MRRPRACHGQQVDARRFTEVIEIVVLTANRDLRLNGGDGRLIDGVDNFDR